MVEGKDRQDEEVEVDEESLTIRPKKRRSLMKKNIVTVIIVQSLRRI